MAFYFLEWSKERHEIKTNLLFWFELELFQRRMEYIWFYYCDWKYRRCSYYRSYRKFLRQMKNTYIFVLSLNKFASYKFPIQIHQIFNSTLIAQNEKGFLGAELFLAFEMGSFDKNWTVQFTQWTANAIGSDLRSSFEIQSRLVWSGLPYSKDKLTRIGRGPFKSELGCEIFPNESFIFVFEQKKTVLVDPYDAVFGQYMHIAHEKETFKPHCICSIVLKLIWQRILPSHSNRLIYV